ncbi:hypothetical protein GCM10027093_62590 [Paraburkholderia jirisanensis]
MPSETIKSKSQATIPVDVRSPLGLQSSDRIELSFNEKEASTRSIPAERSLSSLKGIVKKPAKPVSIEDINRIIATQGASAR